MIDELELVRQARPEVQAPGGEARGAARGALDRAIAGRPGPSSGRRWLGGLGHVVLPALGVVIAIGVVVLFLGLKGHTPTTSTGSRTPAGSTTPAASTPSGTPPDAGDNLTGIWSGHQNGEYNGTLTIVWQESGWKSTGPGIYHANLDGTIKLPAPVGSESVHGTWDRACGNHPCYHGDAIKFRTVSGQASVLYTGTYMPGHMSGSYRTATGHGSWNATQQGH